jgi:hypothetical protein
MFMPPSKMAVAVIRPIISVSADDNNSIDQPLEFRSRGKGEVGLAARTDQRRRQATKLHYLKVLEGDSVASRAWIFAMMPPPTNAQVTKHQKDVQEYQTWLGR